MARESQNSMLMKYKNWHQLVSLLLIYFAWLQIETLSSKKKMPLWNAGITASIQHELKTTPLKAAYGSH